MGDDDKLSQARKKTILQGVQKKRRQRAIATVVVAVILIAVVVGAAIALSAPKTEQRQYIPANIGLLPNCNRPLHTHDDSGTIHVETDQPVNYTIGDFFLIWGKTFNSSGIFPSNQPLPSYLDRCVATAGPPGYHVHPVLTIIYKTNAPSTITMTVNGNQEPLMQNYVFRRDSGAYDIVITYGPGVPASFG